MSEKKHFATPLNALEKIKIRFWFVPVVCNLNLKVFSDLKKLGSEKTAEDRVQVKAHNSRLLAEEYFGKGEFVASWK